MSEEIHGHFVIFCYVLIYIDIFIFDVLYCPEESTGIHPKSRPEVVPRLRAYGY